MQIEGIWLVINRRADFTSYLQQHGGNVAARVAYLEQQTRQMRERGGEIN